MEELNDLIDIGSRSSPEVHGMFQGSPRLPRQASSAAGMTRPSVFGINDEKNRFSCVPLRYIGTRAISTPKMDRSQTFPLMKDEAAGPFVCVMSIAVFEL